MNHSFNACDAGSKSITDRTMLYETHLDPCTCALEFTYEYKIVKQWWDATRNLSSVSRMSSFEQDDISLCFRVVYREVPRLKPGGNKISRRLVNGGSQQAGGTD